MNVKFSKDELAMVYQYAADTKQETLAGLREIVPVIRDRQAREIVESTIRKLDAIPEPECRRFIADTSQRFIQKRDNSIRRRLAAVSYTHLDVYKRQAWKPCFVSVGRWIVIFQM